MSWLEWIAFVTNVVCVYLIVREKDINWPIGVIGSAALIWVFENQKLYAQVGLQIFYVIECFFGWWMWTRRDRRTGMKIIHIGKTKFHTAVFLLVAGIIGMSILYPIFRWTRDPAPLWDSVVTVASLVAEYMLCIKLYEAWGVYLAADLVSLIILAHLRLWITFGTYSLFTLLCILGIIAWRKSLRNSGSGSSSGNSIPSLGATNS
jgi:nicotinamide mononucleotide transporter